MQKVLAYGLWRLGFRDTPYTSMYDVPDAYALKDAYSVKPLWGK